MTYVQVALQAGTHSVFTYRYTLQQPVKVGIRVSVPLGKRQVVGYIVAIQDDPPDFETKDVTKVVDVSPLFDQKQLELAAWIAKHTFARLSDVLSALVSAKRSKNELDETLSQLPDFETKNYTLTSHQADALHQLQQATSPAYLWGVTGSGKTAIFITLIKQVLARGQGVLYLVPEISLANQIYKLLQYHCGAVALMHSGLTPSQRLHAWLQLRDGHIRLALGTRSSVLAPVTNLALIIIDEEHDASYKSQSSPRYHARQVAMKRASQLQAQIILASATPSLESYDAMQKGILRTVMLTQRVWQQELPEFQLIDMRQQKGIFSQQLIDEVYRTATDNKQSLLFFNRRGFGRFYFCPDCGYELQCQNCSVALTYHKKQKIALCHYCGYQNTQVLVQCPKCQSHRAGFQSFGLEKIEEEAQRVFAGLRVLRIDGDIAKNKQQTRTILQTFEQGQADVLLATQIVAKGFNFPKLHLIGILVADLGLSMPDFRAEERTFALLTQISGRAGRFGQKGLVLAQTYQPDAAVLADIQNNTIEQFYRDELEKRRECQFPPFTRLIRLICRSKNESKAQEAAQILAHALQGSDIEVMGPHPALLHIVANNYRWQILLRGHHMAIMIQQLNYTLDQVHISSQVYLEIDPDPLYLL